MAISSWSLMGDPNKFKGDWWNNVGAAQGQVQPDVVSMGNPTPSSAVDMNSSAAGKPWSKKENDNSTKRLRTNNRLFTKSPEQYRAEQMMAQGIFPKVTGYKPAVDENGAPMPGYTDESQPIYDFSQTEVDPNSPVQQQQHGLDQLQNLMGAQVDANMKRNMIDFTPLAQLVDARNAEMGHPTDMAATATKPQDHSQQLMAFADELQKRRADIQKSIFENMKSMRGGSAMDQLVQMMAAKDIEGVGGPTQNNIQARIDQAQWNRAHISHDALMRRIATDPIAKQELQGFNTLSNGLAILKKSNSFTPQQSMEVQRKIMSAMSQSGNGQTSEDERAMQYLRDIGQDGQRVWQYLTGEPQNIPANDPMIKHLKNLMDIEQGNLQELYNRRLNALVPGSSWIYDENKWPDLNRALDNAIKGNKAQVGTLGSTGGGGSKGGRGKSDKPAPTGMPSMAEIDAEIARRKGSK